MKNAAQSLPRTQERENKWIHPILSGHKGIPGHFLHIQFILPLIRKERGPRRRHLCTQFFFAEQKRISVLLPLHLSESHFGGCKSMKTNAVLIWNSERWLGCIEIAPPPIFVVAARKKIEERAISEAEKKFSRYFFFTSMFAFFLRNRETGRCLIFEPSPIPRRDRKWAKITRGSSLVCSPMREHHTRFPVYRHFNSFRDFSHQPIPNTRIFFPSASSHHLGRRSLQVLRK